MYRSCRTPDRCVVTAKVGCIFSCRRSCVIYSRTLAPFVCVCFSVMKFHIIHSTLVLSRAKWPLWRLVRLDFTLRNELVRYVLHPVRDDRTPSISHHSILGSLISSLLPHRLGVAYRDSSLVCYRVTHLEYKSACRVVYASPLSHISDIRELAIDFFLFDR